MDDAFIIDHLYIRSINKQNMKTSFEKKSFDAGSHVEKSEPSALAKKVDACFTNYSMPRQDRKQLALAKLITYGYLNDRMTKRDLVDAIAAKEDCAYLLAEGSRNEYQSLDFSAFDNTIILRNWEIIANHLKVDADTRLVKNYLSSLFSKDTINKAAQNNVLMQQQRQQQQNQRLINAR